MTTVLTITGSDSTGGSGIQADIRTITALGGYPLTAITAVTVQNNSGIRRIHNLPPDLVTEQISSIMEDMRPAAVKIGLMRDVEVIKALRSDIVGCNCIVCDPGFLSSHGTQLVPDDAIEAVVRYLIPEATLLMLRCNEAERLLHCTIATDDDMRCAAQSLTEMGAKAVLLRGGRTTDGMLTALLTTPEGQTFYTSRNTEAWQRHGVGGALSTAVATRLAMGDDMSTALKKAHDYIHRQVAYSVTARTRAERPADLYNKFMSLLAQNYRNEHRVVFYADAMSISTRYLSQITERVMGRTPKQIIADYLMQEAKAMLETSNFAIQEIAYKLGFSSQSQFSNFFHFQQKCTPKEYREKK